MSTLYTLIGIPGSGKSTWANENAGIRNAIIVSSDEIRRELYGDPSIQGNKTQVFEALHKKVKSLLESGHNVIFDATNIYRRRRCETLRMYRNYENIAVYFCTPFDECVRRNAGRDRVVPDEVITRMNEQMEPPELREGFKMIYRIR